MRWLIALVLVAAFFVGVVTPAQAVDTVTHRFTYNPDSPDNAQGYTMFDGFVRSGRDPMTPAGWNDENWAGGGSFSIFLPGPNGRPALTDNGGSFPYDIQGLLQFNGWQDDLGGAAIVSATLRAHLRFSGGCPTPGCPEVVRTVQARPMLVDFNMGNGDGLSPPLSAVLAGGAAHNPRQPNQHLGWTTWEHRGSDILDPETDGLCATCVPWGDDPSHRNGPVAGIDYALNPVVESPVNPNSANAEVNFENYKDIDLTQIFQDWQNGVYENKGVHLTAVDAPALPCTWNPVLGHCDETPEDPITGEIAPWDTKTAPANLFFHGSDTNASGAAVPVPTPEFPRYLPELVITVVPEPATLGLLALGGLVALRRRRR
jgi:hypothetical protein